MKNILKIEESAIFIFATYLISYFQLNYWIYSLCFFLPDLSIAGYLINPKVGAILYNIAHHKAVAITFLLIGLILNSNAILLIGIILLGHSSFDRIFGYGLKYLDSFNNTHLGMIGKK